MALCTIGDSQLMSVVVMGVSGSGKSVVGYALAEKLSFRFIDSDDLHPQSNREKMAAGIALTDEDRWPWLEKVGDALAADKDLVIACSALKRIYRDRIRSRAPKATFVLLETPREELERRIERRQIEEGHFMPVSLLDSQLEILEPLGPTERGFSLTNQGKLPAVIDTAVRLIGRE
jgi:carbohydrate kinase (thermoresistant glucokinase family)